MPIVIANPSIPVVGTPWSLSNVIYDNKSVDVAAETQSNPRALAFSSDGTMMFTSGPSTIFKQYDLSTPWDVSTATFSSNEFEAFNEETNLGNFAFKTDGTKGYVVGSANTRIYQYTFSTAWDVTTGSYDNVNGWVGTQAGTPSSLNFKPDGTKVFITGATSDSVHEYTLPTAWDVGTLNFVASKSVSGQDNQPTGIHFSSDGTTYFVTGSQNDKVYEYNAPTPWSVVGSGFTQSFTFTEGVNLNELSFKPDGTKMYLVGSAAPRRVHQYSL